MRWIKAIAVCALAAVLLPAVIRQAAPLPSLENRSQSLAYPDTAATPLGRAIGPIAAAHPRLTGLARCPIRSKPLPQERSLQGRQRAASTSSTTSGARTSPGRCCSRHCGAPPTAACACACCSTTTTQRGLDERSPRSTRIPTSRCGCSTRSRAARCALLGYLIDFARLNRRMHNKSFTADNQVDDRRRPQHRRRVLRRPATARSSSISTCWRSGPSSRRLAATSTATGQAIGVTRRVDRADRLAAGQHHPFRTGRGDRPALLEREATSRRATGWSSSTICSAASSRSCGRQYGWSATIPPRASASRLRQISCFPNSLQAWANRASA